MISGIIDSHCHLADPRLRDEIGTLIERARGAGVYRLIAVGAIGAIETDQLTVAFAEGHANVFAAIGVHPHDAKDCTDNRIAQLEGLAQSARVVAIGESGLDFHYTRSPIEAQEAALIRHLEMAEKLNKPIVIHCRKAEGRVIALVKQIGLPQRGGMIHCFTGDAESARRFVELGFHISLSGILTFRNAASIREAAAIVPMHRLMVETDAPYLAPEPYRGRRNEPAYIVRTVEVLANIRGIPAAELGEITASNTTRLFELP